jgi:hypothetical protein
MYPYLYNETIQVKTTRVKTTRVWFLSEQNTQVVFGQEIPETAVTKATQWYYAFRGLFHMRIDLHPH